MRKWYVYVVSCSDSTFYTGITTDIKRRVSEHNNKKGARSLFGKLPVELVFQEEHKNQINAARREREIKGWNHLKKLALIESTFEKV